MSFLFSTSDRTHLGVFYQTCRPAVSSYLLKQSIILLLDKNLDKNAAFS